MHQHYHWVRVGVILLLVLTLPACVRSASTVMTPLPSEPPPTATLALAPTATSTATTLATTASSATATAESTIAASPTASLLAASATATKATVSTEVACAGALPTRLQVGSYAYVNPDPPLPNNLREGAGENNPLTGVIQPSQAMKILDGPQCVAGSLWWKVQTLETNLVGWTAEGDAQNYWLVPCESENQCG